jgi:hypothetical protein
LVVHWVALMEGGKAHNFLGTLNGANTGEVYDHSSHFT